MPTEHTKTEGRLSAQAQSRQEGASLRKEAMQALLKGHSEVFLQMAFRTERCETPDTADGYGEKTGDCGDRIEFYLQVDRGLISSVSYRLEGCIHTNACANTVIELAEGTPIEAGWKIDPDRVAAYLETLPEDHYHCAELAVGAFYLALADSQRRRSAVERVYGTRRAKR